MADVGNVELYMGNAAMFINHVLNSPKQPLLSDTLLFNGKGIKKVSVIGVVTECYQREKKTDFRVDDMTGTIMCTFNYNRFAKQNEKWSVLSQNSCRGRTKSVQQAMVNLLVTVKKRIPSQGSFKVGDYIHVVGFVSFFYDQRSINAFQVSKPLPETLARYRMYHLVSLYKNVYCTRSLPRRKPENN